MRIYGIILFCLLSIFSATAQSVKTTDLEKQRKAIAAEIEKNNQLLKENKKSINSALGNLNLVVKQIDNRKKMVKVLTTEIGTLSSDIQRKEAQLQEMAENLELKKQHYTTSIKQMHHQTHQQDQMLFILSADNLVQSFHRVLYLREYANWRKKQAEEIAEQQRLLRAEQLLLQTNKANKLSLAKIKLSEEEKLIQQEKVKKAEVVTLQKNSQKLQADIAKKKRQAQELDNRIARIIAEEIATSQRKAKAQAKAQAEARARAKAATQTRSNKPSTKPEPVDKSPSTGFALTKEEQNLSANFAANKGKLPFPLKGSYRIVGQFGQQQYGELKNVQYNSNGIELKTTAGNTARAVFNGEVTRVFVVPGFQNSVIVRHGNYLTLYSYLAQVLVRQGEQVKTGQDIGKIYSDNENGNETILHFEIWKEQTKLNPEAWLGK
jgi:septal ring factor EnvC (AmiA/AmiB activator)